MKIPSSTYSPDIKIYLHIGDEKIQLADVLYNTATVYGEYDIPAQTQATLIFSIDGVQDSEEVILHKGISKGQSLIHFQYSNPNRANGRHFPV